MEKEGAAHRAGVKAGSNVWVRPAPVRVELLTDPWSVWCWGFEPVRRALELRYPSIEFRPLLGGMFPTMPKPAELGFDLDRFFAVVQRTTGMPIQAGGIRKDPADSTYPACVSVHAARLVAPAKEALYLRALREAAYLDGLNISRPAVGAKVAKRVGIPVDAFNEALESGKAEAAFEAALKILHAQDLHAYPTILLRSGDRTAKVEGFQTLPAILGIAAGVSGRAHAPVPDPTLAQIVPPRERVATREAAEVLGVSMERAFEVLSAAESKGTLARERHPTGDVWRRPAKATTTP